MLEKDAHSRTAPAFDRLIQRKSEVIFLWEQRTRQMVPATRNKDSRTVQDELASFLDTLAWALRDGTAQALKAEKRLAVLHGQQRAGLVDYTISQVIKEYSILRKVLIEILNHPVPLTEIERYTIHESIDLAIEKATTEYATAEQSRIKLALEKAEQSNRDLEQFAAIVAHDLRSPLGTIAGFTEILQDEFQSTSSEDAQKSMTFIRNAVRRMTSLIDGILSYAKLNSSSIEMKEFSCEEAVQAAVQNLKIQITEKSARVFYQNLPVIYGNFPLMTQVFQNLIANALKFNGENPPDICVLVSKEASEDRFEVRDNGIGFDPEKKDEIFGLYKKLDSSSAAHGIGIGLATCKRVIELHGGRIWAESCQQKGASFYFTLPRYQK